ncbi:MAG: S8 family serine peptidase [Phycisphaerales bacterium]|nr:MAG: S8 family serine peptidase [Phycisphaerales bacterium]
MKIVTHLRQWGMLCLACALSGCGTQLKTAGTTDERVLFVEDADPALAALPFVEDELLIQHYPGAEGEVLADLYSEVGATVVEELPEIEMTVLEVPQDRFQPIAESLAETGLIESVQKSYLYEPGEIPDDPMFSQQTHLAQIRAAEAWDVTVGAEDLIIAIVDTGVDRDHPDLEDRIVGGWNMFDRDSDYSDVHGHGTLVAGVAAAVSDNGTGVAGVTWDCPLLAIRTTDEYGRSSSRKLAAAILWAVAHDARVINVSFAPLWSDRVVRAAAQEAFNRGRLVVISAGNGGGTTTARGYKAALFVGAVSSSDRIASFSDRGPFVDLVAPGIGVRSTMLGGGYGAANGTSFAAPIVSGVAALAWSINQDLRPVTIESAVLDTCVDLGTTGKDNVYGHGAIDAAAAVGQAAETSFVPDTTSPSLQISRPANGTIISDRFTAWVTATDQWGVADVVLSIDGMPHATDTRAPYRFVINTASFSAGSHELSFVATDLAGNASQAKTVTVTFRRSLRSTGGSPSRITFNSPSDGAVVSGNVSIRASVSDSDGLATAEWLVDGTTVFVSPISGESTGVSYVWRTASTSSGRHTVTLIITDARGGQTSAQLDLIVQ